MTLNMAMANVFGVGADIVSLHRIESVLARHPKRFPRRILHDEELEDYVGMHDPIGFLARRFAAKEAVAKALGLGFRNSAYAPNICIRSDAYGAPKVCLKNACDRLFPTAQVLLSIADETEYAIAYALALFGKATERAEL